MNYQIGDIIKTKKPHACGTDEWIIVRTGADFKIKCLNCGRLIMLGYEDFTKKVKKTVRKAESEKQ